MIAAVLLLKQFFDFRILEPLNHNHLMRQLKLANLPRDFHLNVQKSMFQDILFPDKEAPKDVKPVKTLSEYWIVKKVNEYFFAPAPNSYSHMAEYVILESKLSDIIIC
jgi:hypothetical protein